tara:strand:- start:133 stop:792 length:660 start_codon:yes stop_codon:yes gene_type:complete
MNIYDIPELRQYLNSRGLESLYSNPTYIEKQNVNPFFQPYEPYENPIYQMKQLQGMIPTGIMTQIDQNQFTDDAGLEEEYYEDFPQKFKPGLNIDFAKQAAKGLLGLFKRNPVITGIGGLLGLLGDRFNLPGVVGGADLRGDTSFDTFRRSTSLADFFRRQRDKKAREEAARIGAAKQKAIIASQQVDTGGGPGSRPGGFGEGAGDFSPSNPTATEGSF